MVVKVNEADGSVFEMVAQGKRKEKAPLRHKVVEVLVKFEGMCWHSYCRNNVEYKYSNDAHLPTFNLIFSQKEAGIGSVYLKTCIPQNTQFCFYCIENSQVWCHNSFVVCVCVSVL